MDSKDEREIIDPLNLACGCSFTFDGKHRRMCEEAGRLRANKNEQNLQAWIEHNKGSQPQLLAAEARMAEVKRDRDAEILKRVHFYAMLAGIVSAPDSVLDAEFISE